MSVTADVMDAKARIGPATIHDYGDQALLLEFDSTAEVLAWTDALRDAELLGVLDIVPASRTVLIKLAGPGIRRPTRQRLGKLHVAPEAVADSAAPADGRADVVDRRGLRRCRPRRGGPADRVDRRARSSPRTPEHRGASDSAVSHRVSPTWSAATTGSRCRRRAEPRTKVPAGVGRPGR